jgi:hypothetical protein
LEDEKTLTLKTETLLAIVQVLKAYDLQPRQVYVTPFDSVHHGTSAAVE